MPVVPALAEGAGQLEDLDEPPEPRVRGGSGRASLMKPLVVLALPGMYLFYKYSQYRREQRELSRRRVTERELQHLHHKIVSGSEAQELKIHWTYGFMGNLELGIRSLSDLAWSVENENGKSGPCQDGCQAAIFTACGSTGRIAWIFGLLFNHFTMHIFEFLDFSLAHAIPSLFKTVKTFKKKSDFTYNSQRLKPPKVEDSKLYLTILSGRYPQA
ncbi:hypothetical protein WN51_02843 [Melipona quadrifasciata]|uniref:Uncharacterized protein n=1 Tax=Melipona quadrifasciata TaxID=166423 RepID=A0A0M9A8U5_9HYME|nr:hypothetical protein WN51_02843 [Melipona quadrifasciata]